MPIRLRASWRNLGPIFFGLPDEPRVRTRRPQQTDIEYNFVRGLPRDVIQKSVCPKRPPYAHDKPCVFQRAFHGSLFFSEDPPQKPNQRERDDLREKHSEIDGG